MPEAPLVICTAGHIDHGKSRLVYALTGVDPDRLPEEKARGMTIDLGFAHGQIDGRDVYFVDVPGHERFIRNMVAGAWGVDAALLVVAADDSVMPQTREHVELLALLGIERCIVAITKMDLVDDEWADQVQEEIAELLDSLGMERLGIVRTSAQTGRGIDELRDALRRLPREAAALRRSAAAWFRMPIDRAFTIRGRGTVVTGTVAHGGVHREDELEVWRTGGQIGPSPAAGLDDLMRRVRVRDLQTHADARESAAGRMRLAVNLAGVALEEVQRGFELATPGYLTAASWVDVSLDWLRMPGKARRRRLRCRLHLATAEVLAELRLLHAPDDGPYRGFAQIRTAVPIVAAWGQRFIVRDESARATLGGGRVLRCASRPWSARRPADEAALQTLLAGSAVERAEAVLRGAGWQPPAPAALAAQAGLADEAEAEAILGELERTGRLIRLGEGAHARLVHPDLCRQAAERLQPRLRDYLDANPRLAGVARGEWKSWMPRACPAELRGALAEWMVHFAQVALSDGFVVPRGHRAALSAEDQKLMDAMLAEFAAGGLQPPALADLTCGTARNQKRLRELAELATQRGRLVSVGPDIRMHQRPYEEAVRNLTEALQKGGRMTVAEIRTLLGSSRKFIVPLLEHLDKIGVTQREGDVRRLTHVPSH